MPTPATSVLPVPTAWDEFEDIVRDIYARRWRDPHAQRHARSGQHQDGVDVYGQPSELEGHYAGVQCKRLADGKLTQAMVEKEIVKAEDFTPALAEFTIATTERRDVNLQAAVRAIDVERRAAGKFRVQIEFWEDLCSTLAEPGNYDLLRKYYSAWLQVLAATIESGPVAAVREHIATTLSEGSRSFVGRQWLFEAVDDFFARYDRGYLRIMADAGLGKTALAAKLSVRLGALPYFFHAPGGLTSDALCRRVLAAQLSAQFPLGRIDSPPETWETNVLLADLLSAAAERRAETRIILVIDGVDEAEAPAPGGNWLLLPDRLPRGVYVILLGRPRRYSLVTAPGTHVEDLQIRADDWRHQRDIMDFLRAKAGDEAIARALAAMSPPLTIDDQVTRLAEASEGNFMYLAYVLAELTNGEVVRRSIARDGFPSGLVGYYEQFWDHLNLQGASGDWDLWEQLQLPVLELLTVAGEPVGLQWLSCHARQSAPKLRQRVLATWRQFLRVDGEGDGERWRFIHQSFADFLARRPELNLRARHRAVASYYHPAPERWAEHEGYARRQLCRHLRRAGMTDELFALVDVPAWEGSQRQSDPGGTTFHRDLEEAWAATEQNTATAAYHAGQRAALNRELWCALGLSSQRSLVEALPVTLVVALVTSGQWTQDHAIDTARRQTNASQRAKALAGLIPSASPAQAPALAREAIQAASLEKTPEIRAKVLTAIATSLPMSEKGEACEAAEAAAREVQEPTQRVLTLAAVAAVIRPGGRAPLVDLALATLPSIRLDDSWSAALRALAPHMSDAQRADFLAAAWTFADARRRSDALAILAATGPADHNAGLAQAAFAEAMSIDRMDSRASPLTTLAPLLSLAELTKVLDAVRFEPLAHCNDRPLIAALLCRRIELGVGDDAIAIAETFVDWSLRGEILEAVAMKLSAMGRSAMALSAARSIPTGMFRGRTLALLVPQLPAHERDHAIRESLAIAASEPLLLGRTLIIEALAPHLPPDLLDEATVLLGTVGDTTYWVRCLKSLLPYLAMSEQRRLLHEALEVLRNSPFEESRSWALSELGPALPTELVDEALAIGMAISDVDRRAKALAGLGPTVPEASRVVDAYARRLFERIASMSDGDMRMYAMESAIRWGDVPITVVDDLLPSIASTLPTQAHDRVLRAIAERLAGSGDMAAALATARKIAAPMVRAHTLARLLPNLEPAMQVTVVSEILDMIRPEQGGGDWALLVRDLAPFLTRQHAIEARHACRRLHDPAGRARLLVLLAPRSPVYWRWPLWKEVVFLAGQCDVWDRGNVLELAANSVPHALFGHVLALARTLPHFYTQSRVVVALAKRLRGGRLAETMGWVRSWPAGEQGRAAALASLAVTLPISERAAALDEAFDAAQIGQSTAWDTDALECLAPLLPVTTLQETLIRVLPTRHEQLRSRIAAVLLPRLTNQDSDVRRATWVGLLLGLAQHERHEFFGSLTRLWPDILCLVGQDAASGLGAAVLSSVRRWR